MELLSDYINKLRFFLAVTGSLVLFFLFVLMDSLFALFIIQNESYCSVLRTKVNLSSELGVSDKVIFYPLSFPVCIWVSCWSKALYFYMILAHVW